MGCGLFFVPGTESFRPKWFLNLPCARQGKRVGGDVLGNNGAGPDIGAGPDRNRRDKGGIDPYEGAFADFGAEFTKTIVIAGDDAGADVGA